MNEVIYVNELVVYIPVIFYFSFGYAKSVLLVYNPVEDKVTCAHTYSDVT